MYARFEDSGLGFYWLTSTNHAPLVADLKAEVPAHLRQWDPARKSWMLDPAAILTVARLVKRHLGIDAPVPPIAVAAQHASTRFFRVVYIGSPKYREDNTYTATAYCEDEHGAGEWKLVIPIGALRGYFEGDLAALFADQNTDDEWALIGLDRDAAGRGEYTPEQIKRAARIAKGKVHPDGNGRDARGDRAVPEGERGGRRPLHPARDSLLDHGGDGVREGAPEAPLRGDGQVRPAVQLSAPASERLDTDRGRRPAGRAPGPGVEDHPVRGHRGRLRAGPHRLIPRGKRTPVPHWLVVP